MSASDFIFACLSVLCVWYNSLVLWCLILSEESNTDATMEDEDQATPTEEDTTLGTNSSHPGKNCFQTMVKKIVQTQGTISNVDFAKSEYFKAFSDGKRIL